jgi:hypothetical protein
MGVIITGGLRRLVEFCEWIWYDLCDDNSIDTPEIKSPLQRGLFCVDGGGATGDRTRANRMTTLSTRPTPAPLYRRFHRTFHFSYFFQIFLSFFSKNPQVFLNY